MSVQDRLPVVAVTDDTPSVESEIGFSTRVLAPNEFLFRTGDTKTCLYRVKSGAVCLYEQSRDERRPPVDFAFPGDLVGLGFLEAHACCGRAVTQTELTCLPLDALPSAIGHNPKAQAQLADAIEREFEFRRASLAEAGRKAPLERLAAFLVSLSRLNAHEGRDPSTVGEFCPSGLAADYLGLSVEALTALLVELERRELIEACPSAGVRLRDIGALEKLASRAAAPVCTTPRKNHAVNCTQGASLSGGQNV
jgi:CRP/FNR family transcriptional regulator, anaerobic regulatory protein